MTQHVCARELLPGETAPWVEQHRRELEELYLRSLELVGRACVEIGGGELDTAERCGRRLVARAPYRESGYRLLMELFSARGDGADALLVYDELRRRLRDELGIAPSQLTQAVYKRLLGPRRGASRSELLERLLGGLLLGLLLRAPGATPVCSPSTAAALRKWRSCGGPSTSSTA